MAGRDLIRSEQKKTTIGISMHDNSHAETHYFCERANEAQDSIHFRDILFDSEQMTSSPRVSIVEACRHFYLKKGSYSLGEGDVLIPVVQGNLFDDQNDEYFFKTYLNYPEISDMKEKAKGVGVLSLFYRMSPTSEFMHPRNELVKLRKEQWWDPKSDAEKDMLVSNVLLLLLLGLTGMLVNGLTAHADTRGCIMDYCQDTFEKAAAFERGVGFTFCDRECRKTLRSTEEGRALIKIAERLSARPFGQPQPSIFISYAREDSRKSDKLLKDLQKIGYQEVWKDVYDIPGGVEFEPVIFSAMEKHHFVISCLSSAALSKPRFFQKELTVALRLQQEKRVHMIPVRLDDCVIPEEISPYNCLDLFPKWAVGIQRIAKSITALWKPFVTGPITSPDEKGGTAKL
jgi:hypothetical protein